MKHKSLFLLLTVLILSLSLCVGGLAYYLYTKDFFSNNTDDKNIQKKSIEKEELFKASVNNLILNITNSRGRIKLMKLSFTLKSNKVDIEQIIDGYNAEMIDLIISLISAKSSEELLTFGGKQLLKEELLNNMNKGLNTLIKADDKIPNTNDIIKKIFFTTFVMK